MRSSRALLRPATNHSYMKEGKSFMSSWLFFDTLFFDTNICPHRPGAVLGEVGAAEGGVGDDEAPGLAVLAEAERLPDGDADGAGET